MPAYKSQQDIARALLEAQGISCAFLSSGGGRYCRDREMSMTASPSMSTHFEWIGFVQAVRLTGQPPAAVQKFRWYTERVHRASTDRADQVVGIQGLITCSPPAS